jgi:hypothetical protein
LRQASGLIPVAPDVLNQPSEPNSKSVLYNGSAVTPEGANNNGKSNQCASAASCGAERSAVARREVRPSDFSDRVFERFWNIPERKTSHPNYLSSFTTENGAGAKGEMGKGEGGIDASSGGSENNWLCTREAHDVGISPQEDRVGTEGEVGEGESRE